MFINNENDCAIAPFRSDNASRVSLIVCVAGIFTVGNRKLCLYLLHGSQLDRSLMARIKEQNNSLYHVRQMADSYLSNFLYEVIQVANISNYHVAHRNFAVSFGRYACHSTKIF